MLTHTHTSDGSGYISVRICILKLWSWILFTSFARMFTKTMNRANSLYYIPYIAQLSQKKMVHKKNILRRKFIKINDARDNHVSFDKLVV